jgi:hypothetical protein
MGEALGGTATTCPAIASPPGRALENGHAFAPFW